jgi:methyl-accepting chemotaxis protein
MRAEGAPSANVLSGRRLRLPMGYQVTIGLSCLLVLVLASSAIAILLISDLRRAQHRLDGRDLSYVSAVTAAALDAKGVANDQRGFLMSGEASFLVEADQRAESVRSALTTASTAAGDSSERDAVTDSRNGFESWMRAIEIEFSTFRKGDRQAAIDASLGPDRELRKSYEQSLARAQSLGNGSIQSAKSSVTDAASRAVWILVIWLIVALMIGGITVYWVVRSIASPVHRLAALLAPDTAG